jgi:hypothetical protein
MAKLLKLRGGTTSQHGSFTGADREVTVDTDKETLAVHNGSTAGGFTMMRSDIMQENLNVNGQSFVSLSNGNIALTPHGNGLVVISAGTAPTANANTNTTAIATTAFVQQELGHVVVLETDSGNVDPVAGDFTNGALFVGQY